MSSNAYNDMDDVDEFFETMLETDATFRNVMEAMVHSAYNTDLDSFEIALVGSTAQAIGDGLSEHEWFCSLDCDPPVQSAIQELGIKSGDQLALLLEQAVSHMRYYGLWPWA